MLEAIACQFSLKDDLVFVEIPVSLTDISDATIKEQLEQAGYGRCLLLLDQLTNLVTEYKQIQQKIKQQLQSEGYILKYKVAQRKPAILNIMVSDDTMSAVAEIIAAFGGQHVSANDVVKAGQEAGIVYGFQKEQILQLVAHASRAESGSKVRATIAVGREAESGKDSVFEPLISDMGNRIRKPVAQSEGKVDLRDFGVIASVKTGDVLMRRLPPTKGKPGMTVTGKALQALDGQEKSWGAGEGAEVSPQDPSLLLASRDGMPRLLEAAVTVDEVFVINKVDASTGHIIFKGAVVINGDVAESMKVVAGGNVFVKGVFEGTLLESGGDVSIGGAVIGHQINDETGSALSTVIRAKGNIQCTLAQYTEFECEGLLNATKQLLHCDVQAAEVLAGMPDKINGKIVGGNYYLGSHLKCGELGALSGSQLKIRLNRLMDPILEKQAVLKNTLLELKAEMEEIRQHVEQMKQMERSPAVMEQLTAMVKDYEEQRRIAAAFIADIKQLEENRRQLLLAVAVEARQKLFTGVECQIGQELTRTRREYGPSRIRLTDQGVVVEAFI
ncbi:FapA family protein [Rheinheimera sp.]|uniref:FapA family protein n=1 Tax=Rheinheimera sp. TaxID=1869214 RepID=UPI00307F21E5